METDIQKKGLQSLAGLTGLQLKNQAASVPIQWLK
jgi:hypothetical protein